MIGAKKRAIIFGVTSGVVFGVLYSGFRWFDEGTFDAGLAVAAVILFGAMMTAYAMQGLKK